MNLLYFSSVFSLTKFEKRPAWTIAVAAKAFWTRLLRWADNRSERHVSRPGGLTGFVQFPTGVCFAPFAKFRWYRGYRMEGLHE